MTEQYNILNAFTCVVCNNVLNDPITLSCGNTICSHCFPISSPNTIKKSMFKCPISECACSTHLFGPELLADAAINEIIQVLHSTNGSFDASKIIPFLNCHSCGSTVLDPVTTPCGHTFCRLCILQSKIDTDTCNACYRPLPKYNTLATQTSNKIIMAIIQYLQLPTDRETTLLDSINLQQRNVPLFVTGKVILPGQTFRLPIFNPQHVRMFRNALVPSSRYHSLCLASVHRDKPQVAQFGTIVQITSVEHRSDAIIIDVVGVDRFRLETHQEQDESSIHGDFDILHESAIKQLSIELPEAQDEQSMIRQKERITQYAIDLAETIIQFVHQLASNSPLPENVIHSQTSGILGPQWFEQMQAVHGPLPSKENPMAVCWWVALVLPVPSNDYYVLLRTIPIIDRLELVINWLQDLQSQWTKCRNIAIHAMSQVPQPNY